MNAVLPAILILGPTAGGKTALAIALAQRLRDAEGRAPGGECICADSMQVYRGMDIGTAKPTPAEQAAASHHLLDLVDPADDGFTVDRWLELAGASIAEIRGRGRYPIVVGGTNLYIQALLEGLFEGPPPDAELRKRLEAQPLDELRAALERVDPAGAARIHANDRKRTIRAMEIHTQTGKPIGDHQQQWFRPENRRRDDIWIIGLDYGVEAINRRINARVKAMFEAGFVEEVSRILAGRGFGRQAAEALGYKQIISHLQGESTLEETIEQIKIRTRRFAKQQRTWLRRLRTRPGALWVDATTESTQSLVDQCFAWVDSHQSEPIFAAKARATADPLPRTGC